MKRTFLTLTVAVFLGGFGSAFAEEQTSENNEKMKKFLGLFPGSDANPKDKVLTRSELHAFLLNKIPSDKTSESTGIWGKRLKNFYEETKGEPDKHDGRGANDGILTKTELLNYVGKK